MTFKFAARSWADLRSRWRVPLAFHLVMQVLGFALIAPLFTFIASWLVGRSGEPVVSNVDLVGFVLSPIGIFFVLLMGSLLGALLLAEFAGHSWISSHVMAGRSVTLRSTLGMVLRLWPRLMLLGLRIFLRLLLLALPFLAVIAVVWFATLAGHDINYYLTDKPPEWKRALLIVAILALIYFFVLQRQVGRWLFAIPMLVLERISPKAALERSSELTKGRVVRVGFPLVSWWVLITLLLVALTWVCRLFSDAGLDWAGISAPRVLPLVAVYVVVSLLGAFLYSAFWFAGHQFMVTRLYVERLDKPSWQPPSLANEAQSSEQRFTRPFLTALPVLLLLSLGALWFIAVQVNLHTKVQVTAHRGASINNPENTMAAFKAALDAGADYVELDVQRTSDQQIVVVHDRDLLRLGGDPRKVDALTLADLETIDIGAHHNPPFPNEPAPTLKQVIDLARGKMKINVELKYNFPDPGLAQAVVDLLRQENFEDQVVITSLDYNALLQVESIEPRLITGHIVTAAVGNVTRSKADFLSLNAAKATVSLVRRAHAAGKQVHVWTVNTPDAMLRMIERGVDNIITDDPALLARVIRERNALSRTQLLGLRLRVLFDIPPPEVTDPAAVKTL
jgi:glycerophosphoryl diester phosphodiesterase